MTDIFEDDKILEKIWKIKGGINKTKDKIEKTKLKNKLKILKNRLIECTHKLYLDFMYEPENYVKCEKCNKKLKEKKACYSYNFFWCVDCYLKFEKQASEEVGKVTGTI